MCHIVNVQFTWHVLFFFNFGIIFQVWVCTEALCISLHFHCSWWEILIWTDTSTGKQRLLGHLVGNHSSLDHLERTELGTEGIHHIWSTKKVREIFTSLCSTSREETEKKHLNTTHHPILWSPLFKHNENAAVGALTTTFQKHTAHI